MYWILNKESGKASICGGLTAVNKLTNININVLYSYFSKRKDKYYVNNVWRIEKTDVIKAKRSVKQITNDF